MEFVIVTGLSGSGKSSVMKALEDIGFFCIDNMPPQLIPDFAAMCNENAEITKVAIVTDIRGGAMFFKLEECITKLHIRGIDVKVLFLEASREVLMKRYKETRRTHPLAQNGRVADGIQEERKRLEFLKKQADYIIDTSNLLTRELKQELDKIFVQNKNFKNLVITVLSFGFKYGIPTDSDLVFDVRFLPNPYYYEELRKLSGNDKPVQDFVMGFEVSHRFLDKLIDMIQFLIPNYVLEGKNQLVISIGCTGGKHRSVTLANKLYERLRNNADYAVRIEHRDIEKDAVVKAH